MESETRTDGGTRPAEFWIGEVDRDPALQEELLRAVPDRPRYVRARGLLLRGRCRVVLGPEGRRGAGFFIGDPERPGVCQAIHRPVAGLVAGLLHECSTCLQILTDRENAEHFASLLPGWEPRPATVHVHPNPTEVPAPDGDARLIEGAEFGDDEVLSEFAREERADLEFAASRGPVATVWENDRIVSFCWAVYETESWWDLDGATAPAHRRRGHGRSAAALLIAHLLKAGKRPVWSALDANEASRRMALTSGFRAVDRMIVLTPPEGFVRGPGCA